MLKNKDIRMLVMIWVVSTLLSVALAGIMMYVFTPGADQVNPTQNTPTTTWASAPATTIAEHVRGLTAWTIAIILPFLFAPLFMLVYIIRRFSEKNNPKPSLFEENVKLEVFWTVTPALVLVAMAVPAYPVLRYMERPPAKPDVVVDVIGAQFFWQYTFPKYGVTVTDDGTGTNPLYLPVNEVVLMNGTSTQVNHAWWVPAFGVKYDVIPGRINSAWIRPTQKGFFKGQCAELCGALHAYMWIHVKVVSEEEFYQWLKSKDAVWPEEDAARIQALLEKNPVAPAATLEAIPAAAAEAEHDDPARQSQ